MGSGRVCLVVVTDGRGEYLEQCLASLDLEQFDLRAVVDDSGDPDYGVWLDGMFSTDLAVHHERRCGLATAVRSAWRAALDLDADFVFHVEEDFTFGPLDLPAMVNVLTRRPHLAQLVLKRQAWSEEEIAAGGQIECDPDAYFQVSSSLGTWVEHRRLFSFNPSLIPRSVFGREWGPILEADVSAEVFADPEAHCAYWGARSDPPRCTHIGEFRSPGYRW